MSLLKLKQNSGTFHPVGVAPRRARRTGGCVIVVEAGVTGRAGLPLATGRQWLRPRHSLQTDLGFDPLVRDLRLKGSGGGKVINSCGSSGASVRLRRVASAHLAVLAARRVELEVVLLGAGRPVLALSRALSCKDNRRNRNVTETLRMRFEQFVLGLQPFIDIAKKTSENL